MLDRGTASFTLASVAVALTMLALAQSMLFYGEYWALLIGPTVALILASAVWFALRRICTGAGRGAHVASVLGIALLCAWSFFGISFGGMVAIPAALALMVAHAIVPSPR